jgi:hypothetical protein
LGKIFFSPCQALAYPLNHIYSRRKKIRFFKRKNERLETEPEIRGIEDLDVIAMKYVKANGEECLDDLDTPAFHPQGLA